MIGADLASLYDRDLTRLAEEIMLYTDEASLWLLAGDIRNPGGNLCLHLCGNLQHYIGKILGGSEYVRDRDHEFAARNVPRERLLTGIEATRAVVVPVLRRIDAAALQSPYPEAVFGFEMTTGYFLVHLSHHLGYHTGQVNYHRRLVG